MSVIQVSRRGVGSISNLRIGALPGSYPIVVEPGGVVRLYKVNFIYTGPAQRLWICWGLKGGGFFGTNFNNGNGLQGGPATFASDSIDVPASVNQPLSFSVNASHAIPSDAPQVSYDVFVWIATQSSPLEANILAITTDSNIVKVQAIATSISSIDAGYQKV